MNRDELELAMGPGAKAFIHPDEIEPFCRLCTGALCAVEIGVGYGASAVLLLMHTRGVVHSIDSFEGDSNGMWRTEPLQVRIHVTHAAQKLKFDVERWALHEGKSHDIAALASQYGLMCDFLYIDGDHRYEAVSQDVGDWLPMLKVGGILALHDSRRVEGTPEGQYARGWPGPTQVAVELATSLDVALVEEAESLTFWRRTQ